MRDFESWNVGSVLMAPARVYLVSIRLRGRRREGDGAHSIDLMPTGCSLMPRTQAPSQGAGQTRPARGRQISLESKGGGAGRLTSELGEVVGHEKPVESVLPLPLEDKVVPLGLKRRAHVVSSVEMGRERDRTMMLPMGHPVSDWQNGTPQSMHLAAWTLQSSSLRDRKSVV